MYMFPNRRNPFESDMDRIMNMLGNNNISSTMEDLSYDQHVDEDTLTVTLDISEYNKDNIRLTVDTKNNKSYLIIEVADRTAHGIQTFRKEIPLRQTVDESSADANENNGVLTIEMDINDSGNFINIK